MTTDSALFDVGQAGFRITIQVKVGGGPFDPAGWSVSMEGRTGELLALEVHPCEAKQDLAEHFTELLHASAMPVLRELTALD